MYLKETYVITIIEKSELKNQKKSFSIHVVKLQSMISQQLKSKDCLAQPDCGKKTNMPQSATESSFFF